MNDRLLLFRRSVLVALALLSLRLGQLQVIQGPAYRSLADRNRLRVVPQPAPRGVIVDRHGRRLAENRVTFRVAAVPQDLPRKADEQEALFSRLGEQLGRPADDLAERFERNRSLPFLPAELAGNLPKPLALRLEEEHARLPGIIVESVMSRQYPLGAAAGHLLGYLSQPSANVYPVLKQYGVRPKDFVGRSGLEEELEPYLRGTTGGSLIEVNHRGRQVRTLGLRPSSAGTPVMLTIDVGLQTAIERQFEADPGAAVVLRPSTGEVLALVSNPGFSPQAFADQDRAGVQAMLDHPLSPMMNRATLGMYLPGSIVKTVVGACALEHGVITTQTTVRCPGYVEFGDRRIHCWNRDGHGPVTLRTALRGSCNVFFMDVGRWLGYERLRAAYQSVGFGRKTGWMLNEQAGRLPTRRLTEGEVAMLGIGQGEFLITPLQAAVMVSAIANDGWLVEPWVVKRIGEHGVDKTNLRPLGWSAETLAAVREGMYAVVNDQQGTGIRARSQKILVLGKTGTAQTGAQGAPHAWFIGFCPGAAPQAAFAIVAEHGGSGGDLPAWIGRIICDYVADHPVTDAGEPSEGSDA